MQSYDSEDLTESTIKHQRIESKDNELDGSRLILPLESPQLKVDNALSEQEELKRQDFESYLKNEDQRIQFAKLIKSLRQREATLEGGIENLYKAQDEQLEAKFLN